jgi:two-component system, cell cycle response regulator
MGSDSTRIRPPRETERRAGGFCLVFVQGEGVLGLRVPLDAEVVLGRDPACAVPLRADDVSRRHARIAPDGDGHLLVDLGSTNGTFLNGAPVEVTRLAPGDRIGLGAFVARYLRAGDAEEAELASLSDLARRDALTGLPNRRAFEEALLREVPRARRAGTSLALLLLDVDRFKQVNDQHGHPAGDRVLAAVAARAGAALRGEDLLARIGGEELCAILPGTDLAAAREAGERLRAAVAATGIDAGDRALEVTVSVGCAALEPDDDTAALLARADARLYDAKRRGRNRVEA